MRRRLAKRWKLGAVIFAAAFRGGVCREQEE
jgi:hypothetical protein